LDHSSFISNTYQVPLLDYALSNIDKETESPVTVCERRVSIATISLLLERGANPNQPFAEEYSDDGTGTTPWRNLLARLYYLYDSLERNHIAKTHDLWADVVGLLLKFGADPNTESSGPVSQRPNADGKLLPWISNIRHERSVLEVIEHRFVPPRRDELLETVGMRLKIKGDEGGMEQRAQQKPALLLEFTEMWKHAIVEQKSMEQAAQQQTSQLRRRIPQPPKSTSSIPPQDKPSTDTVVKKSHLRALMLAIIMLVMVTIIQQVVLVLLYWS
jgi:hypothetical protein